jgi:dolichol kinase
MASTASEPSIQVFELHDPPALCRPVEQPADRTIASQWQPAVTNVRARKHAELRTTSPGPVECLTGSRAALLANETALRQAGYVAVPEPKLLPAPGAPSATRDHLQLGRRLFHAVNGVSTATGYAVLFTHEQVVHIFGTIACIVYIIDRVRIAYPEAVARYTPWANRLLLRAEEQVREAAMIPYAIAVLLTILTVPKSAALVAIYTLAIADPAAAIVGIRWGRRRIAENRSLEGSLAFFVATLAIAALVLGMSTDAPVLTTAAAALTIALAAAACELLPLRIDDNLTIPLFVGFTTWIVCALYGVPRW